MQLLLSVKDKAKANLLLEFLKSLNYVNSVEQVDDEQDFEVLESHKKLVRDRIKNSKASDLLDWETIKNNFDGI